MINHLRHLPILAYALRLNQITVKMKIPFILHLLIAYLTACVLSTDAEERNLDRQKRADDTHPLEAVVNTLSADMAQMKARMGQYYLYQISKNLFYILLIIL